MDEVIVNTKNLFKSFNTKGKGKITVLKGISLQIVKGKISILVGASGAGKSTLLHILGGLDKPDSGDVLIEKKNIYVLSDDKLAKFRNNKIGCSSRLSLNYIIPIILPNTIHQCRKKNL